MTDGTQKKPARSAEEKKAATAAQATDKAKPSEHDLQLETLSGDVRDAMLMQVRNLKRPWEAMTADQQREVANVIETAANSLVRRVVHLLTDFPYPRALVQLGELKVKGSKGLEGKVTCANVAEYRDTLGEHVGKTVLMLMVDSDDFLNSRAEVDIKPDQAEAEV